MSYTIDILYYRISMVTHSLGTHGLSCHPRHASMDSSKKKASISRWLNWCPWGDMPLRWQASGVAGCCCGM